MVLFLPCHLAKLMLSLYKVCQGQADGRLMKSPKGRGGMSYAAFLAIFLGLPLALLLVFLRRRLRDGRLWKLMGLLVIVALAYMAPWDHLAAVWGLWTWAPLQTWRVRFWAIPLEEYLFCLLETVLAVTLLYALLTSRRAKVSGQQEREPRA